MVQIGQVVDILDKQGGDRIRVRLYGSDNGIVNDKEIPFAYPLLPKNFFIKPKIGESVFVFFSEDNNPNSQRLYIGPIISQPQRMNGQDYFNGASDLVAKKYVDVISVLENAKFKTPKAFPNEDNISLVGRKNTDIVLTDDDINIRCGVKTLADETINYNTKNAGFINLRYFPSNLVYNKKYIKKDESDQTNLSLGKVETRGEEIGSVTNIVSDKINLISNLGTPRVKIGDNNEIISEEEITKFLEKGHQLPYGDKLCELLCDFINMFKNHTHAYHGRTIVPAPDVVTFNKKYGNTTDQIGSVILSENIRIN